MNSGLVIAALVAGTQMESSAQVDRLVLGGGFELALLPGSFVPAACPTEEVGLSPVVADRIRCIAFPENSDLQGGYVDRLVDSGWVHIVTEAHVSHFKRTVGENCVLRLDLAGWPMREDGSFPVMDELREQDWAYQVMLLGVDSDTGCNTEE